MAQIPSRPLRLSPLPAGIWPAVAPVLLAMAGTVAVLWPTWLTMVTKWIESETYAHGLVVAPIVLWLVWRRRHVLAALPSRPSWLGALLAVGALGLWVAGELAGVNTAQQLAAVTLLPAAVLTVHGWRATRAIAFPLFFLLFMVPVGEALLPVMMTHTADVTVLALRWTGIPVFREGLHFAIPSGNWSVVEACSGLRYLIASVVLGTLYAYLSYRSILRRTLFIAAAFVVPVVANWARAYMIVMLGHASGMRLAAGVDHLVYGWLFFGLVMGLLFWLGNRWREDEPAVPARSAGATTAGHRTPILGRTSIGTWPAALVPVALAALAVFAVQALRASIEPLPIADRLTATDLLGSGSPPEPAVAPAFSGALQTLQGPVKAHPAVGAWVAYYARQDLPGAEMVNYNNVVFAREDSPWRIIAQARHAVPEAGDVDRFLATGPGGQRMIVWHWYQVGDQASASGTRTKLATLRDLAMGRGDHSLAWVLWTVDGPQADATLSQAMRGAMAAGAQALSAGGR